MVKWQMESSRQGAYGFKLMMAELESEK